MNSPYYYTNAVFFFPDGVFRLSQSNFRNLDLLIATLQILSCLYGRTI